MSNDSRKVPHPSGCTVISFTTNGPCMHSNIQGSGSRPLDAHWRSAAGVRPSHALQSATQPPRGVGAAAGTAPRRLHFPSGAGGYARAEFRRRRGGQNNGRRIYRQCPSQMIYPFSQASRCALFHGSYTCAACGTEYQPYRPRSLNCLSVHRLLDTYLWAGKRARDAVNRRDEVVVRRIRRARSRRSHRGRVQSSSCDLV